MSIDVLVLEGLTLGRKIRLARIAKGLRIVDLAAAAGLNTCDVTNAEHDRPIPRWKLKRILSALRMEPTP